MLENEDRYSVSKKVSIIGLVVNVILSILKIIVGFIFASEALIADGFHSVSDFASTVVILISIKFSQSPADEDHPYGHGKAESLGTVILGFMLAFTGLLLIKNSVTSIWVGKLSTPGQIALWVALLSIVSKELLFRYTFREGKRINSKGLVADAHHHRSDALSSIAALIGILGARLGYPILDPIAGLVVAIFIVKIGIQILGEAVNELMDGVPAEGKLKEIKDRAKSINGVIEVADIKLRTYGPKFIVDLAVVVEDNISVVEGHNIAADVKESIQQYDSNVKEVLVHIDPKKVAYNRS